MGDSSTRGDFEPVDAAMPGVDAIGVGGFGDDHGVGAVGAEASLLRQPGHAGKAAALFIDRPTDLDRADQLNAGAPDRFGGVDGRGDTGLHVAGAASVNAPVAHQATERIDRPPGTGRHDIEMTVQVHQRTFRHAFT